MSVSIADYENTRIEQDARCLVCDCAIPSGAWAVMVGDGPICSSTCVADHLEADAPAPEGVALMLEQARELEDEADVLRHEAALKREAARISSLRQKAGAGR